MKLYETRKKRKGLNHKPDNKATNKEIHGLKTHIVAMEYKANNLDQSDDIDSNEYFKPINIYYLDSTCQKRRNNNNNNNDDNKKKKNKKKSKKKNIKRKRKNNNNKQKNDKNKNKGE